MLMDGSANIRQFADGVKLTYWPNKNLPINTEHIIEFVLD